MVMAADPAHLPCAILVAPDIEKPVHAHALAALDLAAAVLADLHAIAVLDRVRLRRAGDPFAASPL
jgi:hypothetical protein